VINTLRRAFLLLPIFAVLPTTILATEKTKPAKKLRIAAIVTEYRHNAHADVIVGRVIKGYTLDEKGPRPSLQLMSLYVDQTPKGDLSKSLAEKHHFLLAKNVEQALTLGTGKLAIDGVLLVAEHGTYPLSPTSQRLYPKRRLFNEIVKVFKKTGRVVPVFSDKHLADNWKDAKWIYDTARKMKFPIMAGSSVPSAWRQPAIDLPRNTKLKEIVAVSYGGTESYGFHALEMMQSIAERRQGGETGLKSVQTLTGEAVWKAGKQGVFSLDLLKQALNASKIRGRKNQPLTESVKKPVAFIIRYRDGLKAAVLHMSGTAREFSVAWQTKNSPAGKATVFALQETRPYMHFTYLLKGIEPMMHTGQPSWPVERTLLTTGILHAAMRSLTQKNKRIPTPALNIRYTTRWNWKQPPPFPTKKK
jgi:hypothetical protein